MDIGSHLPAETNSAPASYRSRSARATPGAIVRLDAALVRLDDGPANRQPQPHAAPAIGGGLGAAAKELL